MSDRGEAEPSEASARSGVRVGPIDRPVDGPRRPAVLRWLSLAFAAVVISFLAASAYSQLLVARIDERATPIATNAAPSIERLAAARAALGELQVRVFVELRAAEDGVPFDVAAVKGLAARFDAGIRDYLTQPAFPGERDLSRRIEVSAAKLDGALARLEEAVKRGDLAGARQIASTDLRAAVNATDEALHVTTSFNAQHAARLALGIERRRQKSAWITNILNVLCVAAAIAAALVVRSVVIAHGRLVDSRNELLAKRADELDTFATRVAHDLLNPLHTIRVGLELVRMRSSEPEIAPVVGRTIAAVDRAGGVVRDLLAFARSGAAPEPTTQANLAKAASAVFEELAAEARDSDVTLVCERFPDGSVACAEGVLSSILTNLVSNAIKYMGAASRREVTVRATTRGDRVVVEVADTGPGIPGDALDIIFLPHVRGPTAGRSGFGLGLAMVKRLVEAHGGSVAVRSKIGEGSVFTVELPLGAADDAAS